MKPADKTTLPDLAVFGAPPAFTDFMYVGRPIIPGREQLMERIEGVLDRQWLSNAGPCVHELQDRLAEHLGVKHVVCMSNGTTALEIVIRAADISGEVIVPSWTFVASAHSLQWQQITPVFCDIDPVTHNIDPGAVERLITPRTTAILGVHVWGRPCNVEALAEIAERHGLQLMFDAAHAFGCTHNGRMIGSFGRAEVFSFHATKILHTLEGGAVATNDDDLASRMLLMKNFGFTGYDRVEHVGINGKMNEISAAVGLTCLDNVSRLIESNRKNYDEYSNCLSGIPGLKLVTYDDKEKHNYHYIVIEVDAEETGLNRDELLFVLHAENVLARRYFFPGCHNMEPYRSYFPNAGLLLPNTEWLAERVFCLPSGENVSQDDIHKICRILRVAIENSDKFDRVPNELRKMQPPRFGDIGDIKIEE